MDNIKLGEYAKTKDEITQLVGNREVLRAKSTSEEEQIKSNYNNKIRKLERGRDNAIQTIAEEREDKTTQLNTDINSLTESLKDIDKQVEFLKMQDDIESFSVEIDKSLITPRNGATLIWLEDLRKEKYLHIVLFIASNRRPKNKYSLAIRGRCALLSLMFKNYFSYDDVEINDFECRCPIEGEVKQAPTIEELQSWATKHKDTILSDFLPAYEKTKATYLDTITRYALADFEPITSIRQLSDKDAPIICKLTNYDKVSALRLYNGYFYEQSDKTEGDPFDYIKVAGGLYKRTCRQELMQITQTGNTLFGNWYSIHIENRTDRYNPDAIFNQENYKKVIQETTHMLKERLTEEVFARLSFTYPKVEWVHPELISKSYILAER